MLEGVVERFLGNQEQLVLGRGRNGPIPLVDKPGLDAGPLFDRFQPVAQRTDQPFLLKHGRPQPVNQQAQLAQRLLR